MCPAIRKEVVQKVEIVGALAARNSKPWVGVLILGGDEKVSCDKR